MIAAQLHVTVADIRAAGGLEAFTRTMAGQASQRGMLGTGRILAVREGGTKRGKNEGKGRKLQALGGGTKKAQNVCPLEDEEQAAVVEWAKAHEAVCPALALLHHIPNGGDRHAAVAKKLVGQGVKSGVPDLCLPVPCRGYHGLWIEMKRRMEGRVSQNQQWWLDQLGANGYRAVVCRGAEEAIAEIARYLGVRG